jgi:hypothetical protein
MVIEADACAAHAQAALLRADDSDLCSAHHAVVDGATYDPARSIAGTAARLLGELFGWQFAPQVPARERPPRVLFDVLAPRREACDPARGDLRALAPCPEVNQCLQRLVAIVQGADFPACSADPHLAYFPVQLQRELVRRIREEPALRQRAHTLRATAALAETALEHHYSGLLLAQLSSQRQPEALAPIGSARTQALADCLREFPYTQNYQQLLAAEASLLSRPAPALLLRDRDVWALPLAARRAFQLERDKLRMLASKSAKATATSLRETTIAVCGCGPLPISGLMLHTFTGANVLLVDRDTRSVEAASVWVRELERLRVLEPGAVRVVQAPVEQIAWAGAAATHDAAGAAAVASLACDIVLIASLVDHGAKQQLARRLRHSATAEHATTPHTLLLRSAAGLCADLAYEAVDTHAINHLSLPFCGESMPRSQLWPGLEAASAASRGITTDTSSELLVIAHRNVLNTTELYRRLPLSATELRELTQLGDIVSQRELVGTL